eukprot:m.9983 g.9983  ORF g.9983 m.9983 type:complete len:350 (-) comp5888_c0_seq1:454-1503(-)
MAYDYRAEDDQRMGSTFQVDSRYDADRSYHAEMGEEELRPRLLLLGLRSSGKSSIAKVVFHKMSPNETMFLETTRTIDQDTVPANSFLNLQVWDCPAQVDFLDDIYDKQQIFGHPGAIVFVIDAQDEFRRATATLCNLVQEAYSINNNLNFEVLIHKVDGLGNEDKRTITQQIHEAVHDGLYGVDVQISFYLTSIFDVSIFEAMSKISQKLIPQFLGMQGMLDTLSGRCGLLKGFLFDVSTKIYVATDSRTVELSLYEACSDSIDLVTDISGVYSENESQFAVAFDESTEGTVPLRDLVLYLRHITNHLILVCVLKNETFKSKTAIIKTNVGFFRESIQKLLHPPHGSA